MEDKKKYGLKSYFTPKNIIIYIIVAVVLYGAVYVLFLSKKGSSPYQAPSQNSQQSYPSK